MTAAFRVAILYITATLVPPTPQPLEDRNEVDRTRPLRPFPLVIKGTHAAKKCTAEKQDSGVGGAAALRVSNT